MYKHVIGTLDTYPIPELRQPAAANVCRTLDATGADGRSPPRAKAYDVVGIDPQLGAVRAATVFGVRCLYHQARRRFREGTGGFFLASGCSARTPR